MIPWQYNVDILRDTSLPNRIKIEFLSRYFLSGVFRLKPHWSWQYPYVDYLNSTIHVIVCRQWCYTKFHHMLNKRKLVLLIKPTLANYLRWKRVNLLSFVWTPWINTPFSCTPPCKYIVACSFSERFLFFWRLVLQWMVGCTYILWFFSWRTGCCQ